MKILLVSPVDREFMPPSMFPIGIAYITAALESAGHDVTVMDLNGDRENGRARLEKILSNETFGMIGVSGMITQYSRVKELGAYLKSAAQDTPLVIGGPGPTSLPEPYFRNCFADVVCIGEGEETVKELASLLEQKKPLDACAGIMFKDTKRNCITTAKREPIVDVNQIPFPVWKKFDAMPVYVKNFLFRNNKEKGMSIFSTRGCPGKCIYCMCNFGRKLRMRSAENICEEIRLLVETYGVEHIHFLDDTFITSKKRAGDICSMFKNEFKSITWSANVRADYVNKDILQHMAGANCVFLAYGIESASPAVIKYMKKNVSSEQARNALRWTREAGISLRAYFIIGMPCETEATIRETVDFCKENLVGGEFFFATPIPGTELYRYARENKIITNEEVYLNLIGEVRDFLVNLTGMSNEELFTLKEKAEKEINDHLLKHNVPVPKSTRKDPRQTAVSLPEF